MRSNVKRDPRLCLLCNRPLRVSVTSVEGGSLPKILPCQICRPDKVPPGPTPGEAQARANRLYAESRDRENRTWRIRRWYT